MWTVRCSHEAQLHERNCFVTLTYSDDKVPEDFGLDLRHWQLFRKRLREAVGPFRFFCAGEYGGKTLRPHFHAILFGLDFAEDRVLLKRVNGNPLWTSPLLEDKWRNGHVSIGQVTPESISYVTKYCVKKQRALHARCSRVDADTGECWTVRPEFVTMSRRPGLGSKWFDQFMGDVYPSDEVVLSGRRLRPPRYYDLKLPPGELEELKAKRRDRAKARAADETPERRAVRERVAEARLGLLKR